MRSPFKYLGNLRAREERGFNHLPFSALQTIENYRRASSLNRLRIAKASSRFDQGTNT